MFLYPIETLQLLGHFTSFFQWFFLTVILSGSLGFYWANQAVFIFPFEVIKGFSSFRYLFVWLYQFFHYSFYAAVFLSKLQHVVSQGYGFKQASVFHLDIRSLFLSRILPLQTYVWDQIAHLSSLLPIAKLGNQQNG